MSSKEYRECASKVKTAAYVTASIAAVAVGGLAGAKLVVGAVMGNAIVRVVRDIAGHLAGNIAGWGGAANTTRQNIRNGGLAKGLRNTAIPMLLTDALDNAVDALAKKICDDAPVSPMVLDLDGDGVESGGVSFFDHGGDGWAESTRWAGADDGVLVWDSNADGVINDGSELFGNNSVRGNGRKAAHGFAALADFDANGDGKVDSRDSGRDTNNDGVVDGKDKNWENLRVMRWTDANNNGIKESGEESMVTLASLNIRSLGTGFNTSTHVDTHGNEHRQVGSFTKTDGTTATMTDVWFVTDQSVTTYSRSGIPTHSAVITALPELTGGGRVYDLRDAMALDDATDANGNSRLTAPYYSNTRTETRSLRELVAAFSSSAMATNKAGREALAEKILLRWAGAEGAVGRDYWWQNRLHFTTAQKVAVVEAFQGEQWRKGSNYRNPAYSTGQKVNGIYHNRVEQLYGGLMLQTHLKKAAEGIVMSRKAGAAATSTNINDYELSFAKAKTEIGTDAVKRGEFLRSLAAVYGQGEWFVSQMKAGASAWVYEYAYYAEHLAKGVFGGARYRGNDYVGDCGCSNNGDGVNVFQTTGNTADRLEGRGGDDIYHLNYGTGHDRIEEIHRDSHYAGDGNDVVKLAEGILPSQVVLLRAGNDLIIALRDSNNNNSDTLRVAGHFANDVAKVEKVLFSNGVTWDINALTTAGLATAALSSGRGTAGADTFDGALDPANNTLQGGGGGDVYWLGLGSGHDRVDEAAANTAGDGVDTVKIKSGLTAANVKLGRVGADLRIETHNNGALDSSLTISGHYANATARIERITFADNDTVLGPANFSTLPFVDATTGNDNVETLGGNVADVLSGFGGGNDTLRGGNGADVYMFGAGSGNDIVDEAFRNFGSNGDIVRLNSGITASQLSLSRNKTDLIISLRAGGGTAVTDTMTMRDYYANSAARIERVELSDGTLVWGASQLNAVSWTAPSYTTSTTTIRGGAGGEGLYGAGNVNDIFDGDAGGNDNLYGYSGDDVYWLGAGTGRDVIKEHYSNSGDAGDEIRVKSGIAVSSVTLERVGSRHNSGRDLQVQLRDSNNVITDTLTVANYYTDASARVESVVFGNGTRWDANQFDLARIYGGSGNDSLHGLDDRNDIFDSNAGGVDNLYGYGGDDVYYLGAGTGRDVIREHTNNDGDAGDEIRMKSGIAVSSVTLERVGVWNNSGRDLQVQLRDGNNVITDTLTVEYYYTDASARVEAVVFNDGTRWDANQFDLARIYGTSGNESLYGLGDRNDIFDSNAGGIDNLYGYGGDDVYYLGAGTGRDVIREHTDNSGDAGDEIRLKSGIAVSSVTLERVGSRYNSGRDLQVQLRDGNNVITDTLTVEYYYTDASARVEAVVFNDGTRWDANQFDLARIYGTSGNESLYGLGDRNDIFDSNAGGIDNLYGYGGDDVYYLGAGTGRDVIREHTDNSGDAGDEIRLKSGIAVSSVTLERVGSRYNSGRDLQVQLRDSNNVITDTLTVEYYYTDASARVESVVFNDGTRWDANQFDLARIHGTSVNESLYGLGDRNDIFDSNAGGIDNLYGYGGDDVYYLGAGTGRDVIKEHTDNSGDAGDEIRVKSGIAVSSVTLERVGVWYNSGRDLQVQLRDGNNVITDTLTVEFYYTDASARVESVVFNDGTRWDANQFDLARIHGTSVNESLYGLGDRNDIFDSNAGGNDSLYGYGGDDVYYLGAGTGRDVIKEHTDNSGDAGDEIRVKSGIAVSSVTLERVGVWYSSGRDLQVQLRDANNVITDTLTVEFYYTDASARVESVVFNDGTRWDANQFDLARIHGTSVNESLYGLGDRNDIFDGNAGGNDGLYGYGGDDVYYLGAGTGRDVIREHTDNSGDAGDEIRLKTGIAVSSVTLERVGVWYSSGRDLQVQLRDANNVITDTLTVEYYYTDASARVESVVFNDGTRWDANQFDLARIYGGNGNDNLYGLGDRNDVFDSSAGGIDNLYGYGGDDVYYLGAGTGRDVIKEHTDNSGDAGDEIRVKSGIAVSSVTLERVGVWYSSGRDLQVQLRDGNNVITDTLTVEYYYTDASARVESVVFNDGTRWDANQFDLARIYGGNGNDNLYGLGDRNDIFDGSAGGNDSLYGYGGNDIYYLGADTDNDEIYEYIARSRYIARAAGDAGDTGDEIRVKSGFAESQVSLSRDGNDLMVRLLNTDGTATTDSLRVKGHFSHASAKVEKIRAGGKVLAESNYLSLINEIAAFNGGTSTHATMSAVLGAYWQDDTTLAAPV